MKKPRSPRNAPPADDCTQAPFWFWNGPMDAEELARQLREMAARGVRAAMPHPRFGMDRRDYLEGPYWRAFRAVLDQAERIGSKIILYDEYNWPSGGAGGRVTDGHPEFYTRGLDYQTLEAQGPGPFTVEALTPSEPESQTPEAALAAFLVPPDCPCMGDPEQDTGGEPVAAKLWGRVSPDGMRISGPAEAVCSSTQSQGQGIASSRSSNRPHNRTESHGGSGFPHAGGTNWP